MSTVENSLNALGAQTLFSDMTNEDTSSFNQQQQQQQQYQEQNIDNNSSTINMTELMEIPQSPTQLSSIETASSTSDHNYDSSNLSHSSNSSNSSITQSDFDAQFNPISFLNTMHQKLKTSNAPVYSYSHDPATGHFYCQVNFCGKTYENKNARPKKQQAKEEAASIAMKDLSCRMQEFTDLIRQEMIRARTSLQKTNNNKNNNNQIRPYFSRQSYQQQILSPHPLELIPKSIQWYNRQAAQASANGQAKRPCVLLLEFCQMHKLGHPTYKIKDDGRGYYLFECTIFNRTYTPQMGFWKKSDAKDHVSNLAFHYLYEEFVEKEKLEIQQCYGTLAAPVNGIPSPSQLPPSQTYSLIYPSVTDGSNYTYY
ncbi:hypothetical protein C1645_783664 [Glomus cerebriforme]|uniref:DRBM domain-containing protein n=1 Tax=Glomus cerebriforme TaxID=658196 RepID=A0A397SP86_9GLOM|nr:hypothetical protein C1645_783664 [Glomus cerebriforme]